MVTLSVWPGLPMFGLICVMTGVPGNTVKALFRVSFCAVGGHRDVAVPTWRCSRR